MNISNEIIRDLAVSTVEAFLNNKIPMNNFLMEKASEMDLNSDQLKRAVEASNQICYLKLLKTASDRTFEFPLADHSVIIDSMLSPEPSVTFEKVASARGPRRIPVDPMEFFIESTEIEKAASSLGVSDNVDDVEYKSALLQNSYLKLSKELEKMAEEEEVFFAKLKSQALEFSKEASAIEKLAQACDYRKDLFLPLVNLCELDISLEKKAGSGSHPSANSFNSPKKDSLFFSKELQKAASLVHSLVHAKHLLDKRKELNTEVEKIAGILGTIGKGLGMIGGAIRNAEGKLLKPKVKPTVTRSKSLTELAKSNSNITKTAATSPRDFSKPINKVIGGVAGLAGKAYGYAGAGIATAALGVGAHVLGSAYKNKKSIATAAYSKFPILGDALYLKPKGRGVWDSLQG